MQDIEQFATARLTVERLREEHFDDLFRMWQDLKVMATLGGVRGEAVAREKFGLALDHWERYSFGIWALREKITGEFAGHSGLHHFEIDGWPEIDLGYALRAEFWGKGLATEIAKAVLSIGFGILGCEHITAIALPANVASRRVMEKAGFQYERDTVYRDLPHVLYRIRRADYLKQTA